MAAVEDADCHNVTKTDVEDGMNSSREGLMQMYRDLDPHARSLKSACSGLLFFSCLLCGSVEGVFGLIAACGVLCCAAPGSLGTAYAARCTRVMALLAAAMALCQIMVMSSLSWVLPEVPPAVEALCNDHATADTAALAVRERGAQKIVAFAATASRQLQEVAPEALANMRCERAIGFANDVLPYMVAVGFSLEFGLFITALLTAKAAKNITISARNMGANAM